MNQAMDCIKNIIPADSEKCQNFMCPFSRLLKWKINCIKDKVSKELINKAIEDLEIKIALSEIDLEPEEN